MGKIFLYMTMTLDGCLSGPNGELDWFDPSKADKELHGDIVQIVNCAESWMMGYPTGPGLTAFWKNVVNTRDDDKWELEIASAVNKLRAIIISNKPEKPVDGAELIVAKNDAELVDAVMKIKRNAGDIYIPGGVRTAQNFSRLGLIDEYIIMVHPVGIGEGKHLFGKKIKLELMSVKPYKSGVVQMRYRPRRWS
ncbi:MAG: dihydrofolate reductase family protein [Nitrososphaerales archaeon]